MAIPRFSFGAGSNPFYDPNRILVPTQLSAADREKADKFQAESKAYNEAMEKFRREAEAYNAQVEAFNRGLDTAPVTTPSVPKIDSSSSRGGYNPNPAQMFDSRDLPKSTPAPTPSSTVPQFNVTAPVRPADPSFTQADMDAFDAEDAMEQERLLEPDSDDSTELGEVPQQTTKGTNTPSYPGYYYGLAGIYRY